MRPRLLFRDMRRGDMFKMRESIGGGVATLLVLDARPVTGGDWAVDWLWLRPGGGSPSRHSTWGAPGSVFFGRAAVVVVRGDEA